MKILLRQGGKDATKQFENFHRPSVLSRYEHLVIGYVEGTAAAKTTTSAAAQRPVHSATSFGDLIPYGDPNWYQDYESPYYNDSHRAWRAKVRTFVDKEVMPYVTEWDEKGRESQQRVIPSEIYTKMAKAGIDLAISLN